MLDILLLRIGLIMSQEIVTELLKNKYESGDLGWYSNRQIRMMLLNINIDIGITSISQNTMRAVHSGFLDKECYSRGFLFRYRPVRKNNLFNLKRNV